MKFFILWSVLVLSSVTGVTFTKNTLHHEFVEKTASKMIIKMDIEHLAKLDCDKMSTSECDWLRNMLFLTYVSDGAKEYKALVDSNPDPRKWDKETTVAIESAYQRAIIKGAGSAPQARMEAIESHYQLRQLLTGSLVIFVLILTLLCGLSYRKVASEALKVQA